MVADTGASSGASAATLPGPPPAPVSTEPVEYLPYCWRETAEKDAASGHSRVVMNSCPWPPEKTVRDMILVILDPQSQFAVPGRDINAAQIQPVMLYRLESSKNGVISLAETPSAGDEVSLWRRDSVNARKWLSTSSDSGLPKAVVVFTFPPALAPPPAASASGAISYSSEGAIGAFSGPPGPRIV